MDIFNQEFITFAEENVVLILLFLIWSIVWKGLALWKSARLSQRGWFIALLLINSVGILEIIYLFFIAKGYTVESKEEEK